MFHTIHQATRYGERERADPDCVLVRASEDLLVLRDEVLGDRETPVVGVSLRAHERSLVLRPEDVRAVVGPGVRVYVVESDGLLAELRNLLGPCLRLDRGTVRIWSPGARMRCEPADHPVVVALEGEDRADTMEEFGYHYDLARPRVRGRVSIIEDARALLDYELARAEEQTMKTHERLRDAQIECHRLRSRVEAAEASLAVARGSADQR
jgi:hypothetical protein